MPMSLFGALSELVCGAALAAAPACDLALPDGVIEDQAGFAEWMADREEMREIRGIVEAEAEVPQAIAQAFREGNLGIMDYYSLQNIQSDTRMRGSIGRAAEEGGDQG